jgi:hypothetical protein
MLYLYAGIFAIRQTLLRRVIEFGIKADSREAAQATSGVVAGSWRG